MENESFDRDKVALQLIVREHIVPFAVNEESLIEELAQYVARVRRGKVPLTPPDSEGLYGYKGKP